MKRSDGSRRHGSRRRRRDRSRSDEGQGRRRKKRRSRRDRRSHSENGDRENEPEEGEITGSDRERKPSSSSSSSSLSSPPASPCLPSPERDTETQEGETRGQKGGGERVMFVFPSFVETSPETERAGGSVESDVHMALYVPWWWTVSHRMSRPSGELEL